MTNLIDFPNYPSDPKKEKPYHELECPILPKIQEEVLEWCHKKTDFFSSKSKAFWHKISGGDMARTCPSLIKYMRSIKTPIREIAVGLLTENMKDDGLKLHLGTPQLQVKINFPIYNTEDVYTEWYDVPVSVMNELGIRQDENSTANVYNLYKIHNTVERDYPRLAKYNMHNNPIAFNSWIAHRVVAGPNAKYPRIMLATMPVKEPVHLLKRI